MSAFHNAHLPLYPYMDRVWPVLTSNWDKMIFGRFQPVLFIHNGNDVITWKDGINE